MSALKTGADLPLSNLTKMVWATCLAHLFYSNPAATVNVPASWAAYAPALAILMLIVTCGVGILLIWVIARGVERRRIWARALFAALVMLSMPARASSLFNANGMFDGPRLRLSFFLVLAWGVFDLVTAYLLFAPVKADDEPGLAAGPGV